MGRIRLLPALAALVLAAAACGGGGGGDEPLSKQDYQQRLTQASSDLRASAQGVGSDLTKILSGQGDFQKAADDLGKVRDQLDETADNLDDVTPPEDAQEAHDDLVSALHAYSDDLGDFQDALESGDRTEVRKQVAALASLDSVEDLQSASQKLKSLGLTFQT
jgi:hypothetical protein